MRQTLTDLISLCQNAAGRDTSTASQAFFKTRINAHYENILAKLPTHYAEVSRSFATVADQQYYHYPPSIRRVESLEITIGSVKYPITPIVSQDKWNQLNAIQVQPSAIPKYYFNRQRDYGIWPIPGAAYTGTIVYNLRASGMTKTDKTAGTVTVTENDQTVTLAGDTWSTSEVAPDMWFSLADSSGESRGSWYRIASRTDTTNLELESFYEEVGEATANYIIGESPELPEEMHELVAWGAVMDYYASFRQDLDKAVKWGNYYWTGDFNQSSRREQFVVGGLIDMIHRYKDRSDTQLINRDAARVTDTTRVWGETITS